MKGFIDFMREQGVVALAMGFIIGGAISKLVDSFVEDIISPILALPLGNVSNLSGSYLQIDTSKIMWGNFLTVSIDFLVLIFSIYFIFVFLKLNTLDKIK